MGDRIWTGQWPLAPWKEQDAPQQEQVEESISAECEDGDSSR